MAITSATARVPDTTRLEASQSGVRRAGRMKTKSSFMARVSGVRYIR
jgi:hypothetical protein